MSELSHYEFHVRGELPPELEGSLLVASGRRHKDHGRFSRWHDSQADLIRLDLRPGNPSRVDARVLTVDPSGADLGEGFRRTRFDRTAYGTDPAYGYATQPNHGLNYANGKLWTTNLLFGAPLQVDVAMMKPERILRYVEPHEDAPRVTSTSHFAWSKDGRYAYFQQALLYRETANQPVVAGAQHLVRLDTLTGSERIWEILPPPGENQPEASNFHSAFYWEERGQPFVGLLRTGAVVEALAPHAEIEEHEVRRAPASTIWVIEIDDRKSILQASLLPGIRELSGLALSHLDVDVTADDGFVLYANYKQADVGEETHGVNVYGQDAEEVLEHYSGMIVEAINFGKVIRYERRSGRHDLKLFERAYDCGRTSQGHTWLPINIELDESKKYLFCTFSGFRPRLLPEHIRRAYPKETVDPHQVRYVPPLLMRFDAETLQPAYAADRSYLCYAEPLAIAVVGDCATGYVLAFSPEEGLKVFHASDLSRAICSAISHDLWSCQDTHFRSEPAHMVFVRT